MRPRFAESSTCSMLPNGFVTALLGDEIRHPLLHACGKELPDFRPLLSVLSGKILPNDELSNLASTALSKVRRQIEKQRALVESSLERFVRKTC